MIAAESPDAMRRLGARLARAIEALEPDVAAVITFSGDLGAGKTTFVAGLLAALGHAGPVRSPTYTLIEPYQLRGRELYHCDLYRLRHPEELEDIGLLDLRRPGAVLLIEWPERAGELLGPVDLEIRVSYAKKGRAVSLRVGSAVGGELAGKLSGST